MKDKNYSAQRLVRKALRKHFPNKQIHVAHDVTEKGLHVVTSSIKGTFEQRDVDRLRARFNHPNGRVHVERFTQHMDVRFEYTPVVRVK